MENKKLIGLLKNAQGNLTQNEFAKRCGLSSSNLTRIYKNEQKPTPELLKRISKYTRENPSYEDLMIAAEYWKSESDSFFNPVKGLFNYRYNKLREEHGYSFDQLSEITGIDKNTLQGYEDDKLPTRPMEITILAKTFKVDSGYITGETPYRNYEEEIAAYEKADVLAERINALSPDVAKQFILVSNRVVSNMRMADLNSFSFINTFLRTIYGMSELLLEMSQYQNLYKNSDYQESKNDIADKKFMQNKVIVDKSSELQASILMFFDQAKDFWLDTSEDFFKENYKDIVEYFSLDEDDKSMDWRYCSVDDETF